MGQRRVHPHLLHVGHDDREAREARGRLEAQGVQGVRLPADGARLEAPRPGSRPPAAQGQSSGISSLQVTRFPPWRGQRTRKPPCWFA